MSIQDDSQRMWWNELRSLREFPQGESMNQVVYFWEVVLREPGGHLKPHYSRCSKLH